MNTWFTVISDDGSEHTTLLDRGTKADVFAVLDEYVPSAARVLEQDRDDEFAQTLESMNGEEWLRRGNSFPWRKRSSKSRHIAGACREDCEALCPDIRSRHGPDRKAKS